MNWRVIGWGIGLQLLFGLFVFRSATGRFFFAAINETVVAILSAASEGAEFVFGPLADASRGFILAFQVFPGIIFFAALMSVLYYFRVMPLLIRGFAWLFTRLMRLSGAESLCASSNIFVGIESALTIRPHLGEMTRSELCTVLTAGMATVASSVMLAYVGFLRDAFPNIAGHLISASILSAPAALVMSKILVPETDTPVTLGRAIRPSYERDDNVFLAIISGANSGLKLVGGIMALLIAVLGLVALMNLFLAVVGNQVNPFLGAEDTWSIQGFLERAFYPFAILMGVTPQDAPVVARLVGQRMILTEIPSYLALKAAITELSPRSVVITTYALCGFAHFASMAIFVGGVSALAPNRAREISQVGFRALFAATLACLMTACVAGIFFSGKSVLLGS